jgi:hypothetical protein
VDPHFASVLNDAESSMFVQGKKYQLKPRAEVFAALTSSDDRVAAAIKEAASDTVTNVTDYVAMVTCPVAGLPCGRHAGTSAPGRSQPQDCRSGGSPKGTAPDAGKLRARNGRHLSYH